MIRIVLVHTRYFVEVNGERLHILNARSLQWNLKHVFGMKKGQISGIVRELANNGKAEIRVA